MQNLASKSWNRCNHLSGLFYSRDYSTKVPRGKIPSYKAWKWIWPVVKHQFVVDGKYFTEDKWKWNGDIQLTPEEVKSVLK